MEHASSLRIIAHSDLLSKKSEDAVRAELHSLYRSLLGAVACLRLTRADVAVYVSALQRWGHAPKVIHVKRLHVLTDTGEPKVSRGTERSVHGETGRLKPVFISAYFQTQHVNRKKQQVTGCEEQRTCYAQETPTKHSQRPQFVIY